MSRNRSLFPCAAVAFVLGAGVAPGAETRLPVDSFAPGHGDAVANESARPASTADAAQRSLIGTLLERVGKAQKLESLTVDYPVEGSIFPPDMIAPTFLWHDHSETADRWLVEVALDGGATRFHVLVHGLAPPVGEIDPETMSETNEIYQPPPYEASAMAWRPSADVWRAITERSVKEPARLTFIGYREAGGGTPLARGTVTLTTSVDPVGAPIFYRDVPLMPPEEGSGQIMPIKKRGVPLIAWRLRSVSRPDSRLLFNDMPTCANCHSFSADGKTLGMDIDGPQGDKGTYTISPIEKHMVIQNEQIITWNSFKDKYPPGHKTLGFLSRISPTGRYVVTTLDEMIYVANFPDYKFGQVFYPTRGILGYYSVATGAMEALPGADDRDFVHTDGVWTPDGKTIVFARAPAKDPYPEGRALATYAGDPKETPLQYDLYRIPFNAGRGGTPVPVLGASNNGMSNNFPKVSPDGKWIVFVQCKNGQLMRPDSKLWIVPAAGGEARLMRCNTSLMNSWHSFSPNGRWMVFSSKSRSPYTQMWLTHIDADGNDSPAILIENSTAANRAVNIPEFVNIGDDDLIDVQVPAVSHYRVFHRANTLSEQGRFAEAVAEYEKALREEPDAARMHANLSKALVQLGQTEKALKHTRLALEQNPFHYEMQTNMGYLLALKGEYDEARQHLDFAIALHPRHQVAWFNRATLNLQLGDLPAALADYDETLARQPRYPDALDGRGAVRQALGDLDGALADFDASLSMKPNSVKAHYLRARARLAAGDFEGAADDVQQALRRLPPASPMRADAESLKRQIDAASGAGR